MDGDRIADAENVDEVRERRGEIEGVASPNEPGEEMDAFPASTGGLPPTGELENRLRPMRSTLTKSTRTATPSRTRAT